MYDKVLTMVCQRPTGQLKPKNKIYTFFIFDIQLRTLSMVWIARRCLARFRFANAMPAGPSADARAPAEGEGVRQKSGPPYFVSLFVRARCRKVTKMCSLNTRAK